MDAAGALREKLIAAYPATKFGEVRPTVVTGLYEVELGKNLAYIEPSGRYFFFGHIYDMHDQADLTADRMSEHARNSIFADRDVLAQLDTFLIREGEPMLTVFSDPLCSFCKSFERTLESLPEIGVRIAVLAYQPGSEGIAHRILCAPDPAAAWQAWMLADTTPPALAAAGSECDLKTIERNEVLARKLDVVGTPTLITEDGRMQSGAIEVQALKTWLEQTTAVAAVENEK